MIRTYAAQFPSSQAGKLATISAQLFNYSNVAGTTFTGVGSPGSGVIYEKGNGGYAVRFDPGDGFEGTILWTTGGADSRTALEEINANPSSGNGPLARTITITSDGSTPIVGASVAMTGGFSGTTNGSGQVVFNHVSGSYTITAAKTGYAGVSSGSLTLTATGTTTLTMAAVSITPSADPTRLTVYGVAYNGDGSLATSEPVYFRLAALPTGTVGSFGFEKLTATSDASTAIFQKELIRGATYLARRDGGKEVTIAVPATGGSWEIDEVIAGRADTL